MLRKIFSKEPSQATEPIFPGESFSIFKLNLSDGWGLATINKAYDNYPNKRFFPCHVLVELQIINSNENGHLTDAEAARLYEIEEEIIQLLKKHQLVHLIGRITRNGSRDILLYTDLPKTPEKEVFEYCD